VATNAITIIAGAKTRKENGLFTDLGLVAISAALVRSEAEELSLTGAGPENSFLLFLVEF
jgi:hypothetical protein